MTPKDKEPRSAGELEVGSCARRRRSRRVSFAETTVHVFKRDEESESPASSTPILSKKCGDSYNELTVGIPGLHSQGVDSMNTSPEEDEEEDGSRLRFVRDVDSSSPGSAVGSIMSNEDENFFGPVSTSFIDSSCLSESGMSDGDNHDITLDSTAFSLHFRNIAPPGDNSANSAGSMGTPEDTIPCMPFLVGRDQTEDMISKSSVGQVTNVSEDWKSLVISRSGSYHYGKLSQSLDALIDQVELSMLHNSPNRDCKVYVHQTDEVGAIHEPGMDETKLANKNSFSDKPGHVIHCISSVGNPASNGCLLSAKSKSSTNQSNIEKMQEIFSPVAAVEHAKVDDKAILPEIAIILDQHSEQLSPSHGELPNCMNERSCHFQQPTFRSIAEDKIYHDSEQDLVTVDIAHTPKCTAKFFRSSTMEEKTPSEQQHFPSQTVPSNNSLCISAGEKSISPMKTPSNAKAPPVSSLLGSVSSFQTKQRQLLDFPVLYYNSAREQSASLKWESMEHGEKISAIEKHIIRSKMKSEFQSDYSREPSRKGSVLTVLQHSTNDTSDDPSMKHAGISTVNVDAVEVITGKTEGMDLIKALDTSGNIVYLTELDKNAALEDIDISMQTPHNAAKKIQLSTLKGSISSFQAKHRLLKYGSVQSLNKSMHNSASERSASLKMKFVKHGERLSSIKSHITRSRFKSTAQADFDATPLKKDLFITDFQGSLIGTNNDSCVGDPGICNVDMDANKLNADKQMDVADICSNLTCSGNDSYLTVFDKNVAFTESVENGQSERCVEFCGDSSVELPHPLDAYASSIDRIADLKESNLALDVSSKYAPANKDKSSISSNGRFTHGADEITNSSYLLECKGLQPAISLIYPSAEKSSTEKIVECTNNHSFSKMDLISPRKSQNSLSYDHGMNHHCSKSHQEMNYDYNVDVIGDTSKKLMSCMENACLSGSYSINNSQVTVPEVIGGSMITSIKHTDQDKTLDIAVRASENCRNDVLSKLSEKTSQLLPLSISELNIHKLDELEGLLDELQVARKYDGILFTLRNQHYFCDPHQKRIIDARSLLQKLGLAKAREQMKFMKLKILCIKAQFFHSKAEECDKLKSSYIQLFNLSMRAVKLDEACDCKHQEEHYRLIAMKKELGILEQNIKVLEKSFGASCKLTGEMSCNDVIKVVDEHITRRALCNDIQQHLQLWKLSNVVLKNGHYEVVLDYCNLLFQRFTIDKNQFSSIVANNVCSAANIVKKFPNMDACVAFEFVFKPNVDHKLTNANFIHGKTMETNLIIGTLIYVLEEILLSRLELWNLVFSTFLMPSQHELQLQLCFYSSRHCRKLILGIDMTNLNCGVYPGNPSELKIQVYEQQTSFLLSTVNEVIRTVRSLDWGPFLLLRLCRCVSQVVQFSG